MTKLKRFGIIILSVLLLVSCYRHKETPVPWGQATEDTGVFDLTDIQQAGELIGLTLSGPDTYYDFGGRHLGVQYLLAERFAGTLGVKLRVEVCRDTSELLSRMAADDADLAFIRLDADTMQTGWAVGKGKPMLAQALADWYKPSMLAETRNVEHEWLTYRRVARKVFAPMMSKGVISRYDGLFKRYARLIGWDWRLIAALCYQESTFDPLARSFAGAQGLMQIMPETADHLGLPRQKLNDPEANIEAGTRYLKELEGQLRAVTDRSERQNLTMAAYNCGLNHLRDAMRLAEHDGRDPHSWRDVRMYILRLSEPRYYQDPLVKWGYVRGTETANYVELICERYEKYKINAR